MNRCQSSLLASCLTFGLLTGCLPTTSTLSRSPASDAPPIVTDPSKANVKASPAVVDDSTPRHLVSVDLFKDDVVDGWTINGWAWDNPGAAKLFTAAGPDGESVLQITEKTAYAGLTFDHLTASHSSSAPILSDDLVLLSFKVNPGTSALEKLEIQLEENGKSVAIEKYVAGGLEANTWSLVQIPVTELLDPSEQFFRVTFFNDSENALKFRIADLKFERLNAQPSPTAPVAGSTTSPAAPPATPPMSTTAAITTVTAAPAAVPSSAVLTILFDEADKAPWSSSGWIWGGAMVSLDTSLASSGSKSLAVALKGTGAAPSAFVMGNSQAETPTSGVTAISFDIDAGTANLTNLSAVVLRLESDANGNASNDVAIGGYVVATPPNMAALQASAWTHVSIPMSALKSGSALTTFNKVSWVGETSVAFHLDKIALESGASSGGGGTVTPKPSVTPSPTLSATPKPSVTPTPVPSVTPKPTPSPSVTPTPTGKPTFLPVTLDGNGMAELNSAKAYYEIYVPKAKYNSATPIPLLIFAHGCTTDANAGRNSIWLVGGSTSASNAKTPYIAISLGGRDSPDGNATVCWNPGSDGAIVMAAITDVKRYFNIDPRRIYMSGYSSGGDLTYRVGFENAGTFAGLLVENSSPFRDTGSTQAKLLAAASWKINIGHLLHTSDGTYPKAGVVAELTAVKNAGFPVSQFEAPGAHYDNKTNADYVKYLLPLLDQGWVSPATLGAPAPLPTTPSPTTPAVAAGWLSTSGNHLYLNGSVWEGHGANVHDIRDCDSSAPYIQANGVPYPISANGMENADGIALVKSRIDLVTGWGAKFIRIPLENHRTATSYLNSTFYHDSIKQIVDYIGTKPGVYVLLSMWQDPTQDASWLATSGTNLILAQLAKDFYAYPNVMFGVTNEPHDVKDPANPSVWQNAATDKIVWNSMQASVKAIRDAEASLGSNRHIITVQGTYDYARHVEYYIKNPITIENGNNIAYEIHVYNNPGDFDSLLAPSVSLPMIVGEFGPVVDQWHNSTVAQVMTGSSSLVAKMRAAHVPYAAWTLHTSCGPNLISSSTTGTWDVNTDSNSSKVYATDWGRALILDLSTK